MERGVGKDFSFRDGEKERSLEERDSLDEMDARSSQRMMMMEYYLRGHEWISGEKSS